MKLANVITKVMIFAIYLSLINSYDYFSGESDRSLYNHYKFKTDTYIDCDRNGQLILKQTQLSKGIYGRALLVKKYESDKPDNKIYVLKLVGEKTMVMPGYMDDLKQKVDRMVEIQNKDNVKSEFIVNIYDHIKYTHYGKECYAILMEYVPGTPLLSNLYISDKILLNRLIYTMLVGVLFFNKNLNTIHNDLHESNFVFVIDKENAALSKAVIIDIDDCEIKTNENTHKDKESLALDIKMMLYGTVHQTGFAEFENFEGAMMQSGYTNEDGEIEGDMIQSGKTNEDGEIKGGMIQSSKTKEGGEIGAMRKVLESLEDNKTNLDSIINLFRRSVCKNYDICPSLTENIQPIKRRNSYDPQKCNGEYLGRRRKRRTNRK
jgi:hypothetical protein